MKRYFWLIIFLLPLQLFAQDTTMNSLTKDMDGQTSDSKQPVKVFDSERLINAYTPETVGKGKMDFRVIHNFYDVAGSAGGIKRFFGFDNAADIKIGFEIGLTKNFDLLISRVRGGEPYNNSFSQVQKIYELGLKWKLLQQMENDPQHPLSITLFANEAICTMPVPNGVLNSSPAIRDSAETNFQDFSERMSQAVQLMIARKFGGVSLQISGTYVHRNRVIKGDDKSIFALGGAARIPITRKFAFIIDYFHPFHSESAKQFFSKSNSAVHQPIKFYDPLGIGFEILTAGHVFHLNFTNAVEILENRMIPRTVTSWGKGQFRWGFTISRTFVLWRDKN